MNNLERHTITGKILFVAIAAMTITGYSQSEGIEKVAQPVEIGFNTAVSRTARATTSVNADFTKFMAYAYSTTGAFADTTAVNVLIPGTDFELKGSIWSSGDSVFHWPVTDQVSFFVFLPNTMVRLSWGAASANKVPTLTYTAKDVVKDQEDLVVAEAMNKQEAISDTTEAVVLNFKHALMKIGSKTEGRGSGITYTLNKVVVKARDKGVYTCGTTSTTETTLDTWAIPDDVTTTTGYIIEPATVLSIVGAGGDGTADETLVEAGYTAMLVPQALTNVTFEIYYKVEAGGVMLLDRIITPGEIAFIEGNWTAGQSIAYILTLKGAGRMTITGSVVDSWNSIDTPK